MKLIKLFSLCALIAVAACHGSQKEMYYVKNETSLPVYVGLYLVGGGKVTNSASKVFMLERDQYATFAPQKSLIPGRIQHFVFSSSLDRLAHNVVKNKKDEYVFSKALTPNVAFYAITGDLENMKLETRSVKPSGSRATTSYNLKKEFADAERKRKAEATTTGKANVRGERLERLEQRSQGLAESSATFADTARQLREQQEKEYNESFLGKAEAKVKKWTGKTTATP